MASSKHHYLPIETTDGSWIERPDLYLLARMAYPNEKDNQAVLDAYDAMRRADNSHSDLNAFERIIDVEFLQRRTRDRILSGSILVEMLRIWATTGRPAGYRQAVRLVAHNDKTYRKIPSSDESLQRSIRRAFTEFGKTAHYEAAAIFLGADYFEADLEKFEQFLSLARSFELIAQKAAEHEAFDWKPWRVPERIIAANSFSVPLLNDQELATVKG